MPAALTRREWLRLSAGALLSLGLWPGRLRGADAPATEDFTFIALNDLHALEAACRPWFDHVVRQMKASAPTAEFCLLGGDLADNCTPAQLTLLQDSFAALGIPCHAVVGNHDYKSITDRSAYEQIFPGQINYSFTHRGWQIIGLDSSEGTKVEGHPNISHHFCLALSKPVQTGSSSPYHPVHSFSVGRLRLGPARSMPTIYLSAVTG